MKTKTHIIHTLTAIFFVVFVAPAAILAQADDKANQAAGFKQAVQQSMAGLKKYQWIETTTITKDGEVKAVKQNQCSYGPDGKVKKVPIETEKPKEPRGVRGLVAAKVKAEVEEYMKKVGDLMHKYVPPDTARIDAAADAGKGTVDIQDRIVRLSFKDFVKANDLFSVTLNVGTNEIVDINISTWVDSENDRVALAVGFGKLGDGTSYANKTVLDFKDKNVKVVVENSGHKLL